MYPMIPAELTQAVVQLVVCFITVAGAAFGLVVCNRA